MSPRWLSQTQRTEILALNVSVKVTEIYTRKYQFKFGKSINSRKDDWFVYYFLGKWVGGSWILFQRKGQCLHVVRKMLPNCYFEKTHFDCQTFIFSMKGKSLKIFYIVTDTAPVYHAFGCGQHEMNIPNIRWFINLCNKVTQRYQLRTAYFSLWLRRFDIHVLNHIKNSRMC